MSTSMETTQHVSHRQVSQLFHNKFIVVLGDSIQRSVYKDLVLLLQKEKYLTLHQLKRKGEMTFEQDCLVEGGCLDRMHNGTNYREVRQYRSGHHLVRFYFVTRIYSRYMQSVLQDFRHGLKPDLLIINSCLWDISRYSSNWIQNYRDDLCSFFEGLKGALPEETLVIWNLTMPLGEKVKGGFLVPESEHRTPQLRQDVIEANFYSGTLADAYQMDVLDLHFLFRFSLQHRTEDGVHWNAVAHRGITSLLSRHAAEAWGVVLPCPGTAVEAGELAARGNPGRHTGVRPREAASARRPPRPTSAERHSRKRHFNSREDAPRRDFAPCRFWDMLPRPHFRPEHTHRFVGNNFSSRQWHYEPNPYTMRRGHNIHHYVPYTTHRPHHHGNWGYY